MTEKPNKIAVSIDEACEISSFGRTQIYGAIGAGLLPAKKFGRRTAVLVSDLEKFLAALPNVIERERAAAVLPSATESDGRQEVGIARPLRQAGVAREHQGSR
jgi:hypothetical protein